MKIQKMQKRKIKYIAIHCTGADQNQTVASIQRYWTLVKKWRNPGYHRVIDKNGIIYQLMHFDNVSNGVQGFNSETINICYIGGQHFDNRTEAQKAGILDCIHEAIEYINDLEGLPEIEKIQAKKNEIIIQGHRDFPHVNKACPQFDAKEEYSWITS